MIDKNNFLICNPLDYTFVSVKLFFLGRKFRFSSKSMKSWSNFPIILYFEDKMAFWKSHADPVSWWSCRYRPLRINTAVPCSEGRRCWKQCELCCLLSESWKQSTLWENDLHAEAQHCREHTNEMIYCLLSYDPISVHNLCVEVLNPCFLDWSSVSHMLSCVRT